MSLPVSFALSIWELPFEEKVELLSTWVLQFPRDEQTRFMRIFNQLFEPQITLALIFGPKGVVEVTHVQVTGENLFLEMSWSEFYGISYKYKIYKIFPNWKLWKSWYDRIYIERLLQEKRDMYEDRFRLFRNHTEYMHSLRDIYRKMQKNEYGRKKMKEILQGEIQAIVYKVKCIENIRKNWAALKIQKAYRGAECMFCNNKFYYGIGPFCSRECLRLEFSD